MFGGRLAELLADLPEIALIIAGRDEAKAQRFCRQYIGKARVEPLRLDRRNIASALKTIKCDLVVDASGPFQAYGAEPYDVIAACIDARVHYLDFADAADFVFGVSKFDDQAKEAGIFVLSGASSFPVLTAAVLREMAKTMDIVSVEGGIAPSPFAGIGLNVMRAVVGYAGAPVKLWRGGTQAKGIGLAESRRFTIAPPGQLPLRNIRFSLVDVPDLQVIPPQYSTLQDIWMGAGPVPEFLHRLLNLLAQARARFALPSLEPFSRLFYAVLNRMKFGEHRGGMYVIARGTSAGATVECSWHLLAEGDDGPYIPSMAIEGVVRKLLVGKRPAAGARPATNALELEDYDRLFEGREISTGFRGHASNDTIYRTLLGSAFDTLPPRLQALHGNRHERRWAGVASVRRGRGLLARTIASVFGFPPTGNDVPVTVHFSPKQDNECWTRNFGAASFRSQQSLGTGRDQFLLVERFGVVAVSLALVVENGRLFLLPRRWSIGGIPMPAALLPRGRSCEFEQGGDFHFDVTIDIPFIGLVAAYRGRLTPVG